MGLDPLLGRRQLPQGHGIPQIPSGNDDLIRRFQKFREPFQPCLVFNLGEQPDIRSAVFIQRLPDGFQIPSAAHKGLHNAGDAAGRRNADILHIGCRHRRRFQIRSRQSQTLPSPQNAASKDLCHRAGLSLLRDPQQQLAVIQKHLLSGQ